MPGGKPRPDSALSVASTVEGERKRERVFYRPPPHAKVRLQPAFQPGASPAGQSSRFLLYNGVGIIKSHDSDQENSLDVEFHDIAVHHALHLSNSEGATMAALSRKVLATATTGDDVVGGKLTVNYFSSGDANKVWSIVLEEEEIRGVAAGDKWVAVVTNKNHLRMFTAGGLQREVVMVMGPLVTMVGEGDRLLVVTQAGHPLPGQQSLVYTLYSFTTALKPLNTSPLSLPLAPDSELYWAGFSDTLTPCTADTAGWVRALDMTTNLWHPIINTRDHVGGKSDFHYIISVSHTESVLHGVLCKGAKYPSTIPNPLPTVLPLEVPLTVQTCLNVALQDKFISANPAPADEMEEIMDTVEQSEVKCIVKLFALACKSDHESRAVEVASLMPNLETLQLAIKYAAELGRVGLVEKLDKLAREKPGKEEKEERKAREHADGNERQEIFAPILESHLLAPVEVLTSHGEQDDVEKIHQPMIEPVHFNKHGGFFANVNVGGLNNCSIFVHGGVKVRANLSVLSCVWPALLPLVDSAMCQDEEIVLIMPWAVKSTVQSVINLLYSGASGLVSEDQAVLINEFFQVVNFQINLTRVLKEVDVISDDLCTFEKETFIRPCYDDDSDDEDSDDKTGTIVKETNENVQNRDKISFVVQKHSVKLLVDHSTNCNSSCTNKCNKMINSWLESDVELLKSKFKAQKDVETKMNLMNHLKSQDCVGISTDRYQVKGHKFCNKFFAHITGISVYLIRTVMHDFWRGLRLYEHGNRGIMKQQVGTTNFITWLKDFAEWYGQYSPEHEKIILSYWLRKGVLHKLYLEDSPGPHIKSSTFYLYFDLYFGPNRKLKELPCVRISKYSSHSQCNTCVALSTNRRQSKTDAEMKVAKDLINQHKLIFGGAFRKIQEVKQSALVRPTDHLLLQVDGMDNHKSYLPRYLHNAKELQGTERLASKISGCILWSGLYDAKRKLLFYLNHDQVCFQYNIFAKNSTKII